ncbi:MAG TPA: bifunctional alpha,alpha-trehalose-phosphate synthase (UDP-forming)/trehalose-phosphatase [Candidatus Limnocylindrales bacterium]|nr:bifunctional alpha,alpha-trehalose-phosphate synthase (UDP-forming)/trehalose-phosphatase [Candidatus Limnocylindrales bacterium]
MIIVSNRLPVSVKKVNGKLEFHQSIGGLATGLSSYIKSRKNMWIGWPGLNSEDLSEAEKQEITTELRKRNCYPVFLSKKQVDEFYNGYSNEMLWPFFHSLPVPEEKLDKHWAAYKHVNLLFADVVMGVTKPTSTVWVHDYQLMLVPHMIRLSRPHETIGFFLHTPFPPAQEFTKLPHAKTIVQGLLGSDLIGFHTQEYVQNFADACEELRAGIPSGGQVILSNRAVQVGDFPISIDYEKFAEANNSEIVRINYQRLKQKFGKYKVILAFERLDPSKAFIERLQAYREFLRRNAQLRGKVIMIMIAVPSRTDIPVYKKLKEDVELLVKKINSEFGKPGWQPVHYMYKIIPFEEVPAYYQLADVAFITPLRDGMNLMAKEYVASKANKDGVLILSETAGAAQELTNALLVNPHKQDSLVAGLTKAMTMTPTELQHRLSEMQKHIADNTIHKWKDSFSRTLRSSDLVLQHRTHRLRDGYYQQLLEDFASAERPAVILDYDGVLSPFFDEPKHAKPTKSVFSLLEKLSRRVRNNLLIISGRSKKDIEKWFSAMPATLSAEHGALIRPHAKKWQSEPILNQGWKQIMLPTLQKYAAKTPGASVEEKETSLVWHYRKASPYYAQKNITILKRVLRPVLKAYGLVLYSGNMILELKAADGANKGKVVKEWLYGTEDFILCIGDDFTDEDMFAVLPEHAYTVKVGPGKTLAKYRLRSYEDVSRLLTRMLKQPALSDRPAYNHLHEGRSVLLEKSS